MEIHDRGQNPRRPELVRDRRKTNLLVGSYDFNLYCTDAATGKSNWVYETGNYINSTPAVAGGLTAFGGCDGMLYGVALANGSLASSNEIGAPSRPLWHWRTGLPTSVITRISSYAWT